MEVLSLIICFIAGILGIVFYAKIWIACNKISDIQARIANNFKTKEEERLENFRNASDCVKPIGDEFVVGERVIYPPMNRVMLIKSITDKGIECYSVNDKGKEEFEGVYKAEQIRHM